MEHLFILVSPDSVNTDRTDVIIKCKSMKIRKLRFVLQLPHKSLKYLKSKHKNKSNACALCISPSYISVFLALFFVFFILFLLVIHICIRGYWTKSRDNRCFIIRDNWSKHGILLQNHEQMLLYLVKCFYYFRNWKRTALT